MGRGHGRHGVLAHPSKRESPSLLPHKPADVPDMSHAVVLEAFAAIPELKAHCGAVREVASRDGLTNRVFLLEAEKGRFFLRIPAREDEGRIDRHAEAVNLEIAAGLGLAVPPLVCVPEAGILLTREVEHLVADRSGLPEALGRAVAKLHSCAEAFRGQLDPDAVCAARLALLAGNAILEEAAQPLVAALSRAALKPDLGTGAVCVPSHGDLSGGNCLMTAGRLWLIDWEYSAMAEPAWDLAYATVENGFSGIEESRFLQAYRDGGGRDFCPSVRDLAFMKARCDAVSALWAYGEAASGRDKLPLLAFARERRDRALSRMAALS